MQRFLPALVRIVVVVLFVILLIIGLAILARSLNLAALIPVGDPSSTATPVAGRLVPTADPDLSDETQVIRAWIIQDQPEMNPAVTFPLVEITTMQMRQETQARVFKVTGETWLNESFLLWNGQVYHLSTAFGDSGISQLFVTDLDENGAPELVYGCHFGSGVSSTVIGLFEFAGQGRLLETRLEDSPMNRLELAQLDAQTVLARNTLPGGDGRIWRLAWDGAHFALAIDA